MDDPFLAQLKQDIQHVCEEKYGHVSVVFDELVPEGDNRAAVRFTISDQLGFIRRGTRGNWKLAKPICISLRKTCQPSVLLLHRPSACLAMNGPLPLLSTVVTWYPSLFAFL